MSLAHSITEPAQGQPPMEEALQDDSPVKMRIYIAQAKGLVSRDRNGFSDPYVKITIGGQRFTTHVIYKTLDPVWDAAYEFDVEPLSLPEKVQLVFWDKDRIGKDYLGTVEIPFDAAIWQDSIPMHYDDPDNKTQWYTLMPSPDKPGKKVSGQVEIKFGFIDSNLAAVFSDSRERCRLIWNRLQSGRNKLGLGQRMFHSPSHDYDSIRVEDIPLAGEGAVPADLDSQRLHTPSPPPPSSTSTTISATSDSKLSRPLHGVVFMEVVSASSLPRTHNMTRTGFDMDPFVVVSFGKSIFRTRVIRHHLNPTWNAKLMFKVHHGQENYKIKYSVHDWDKISGNDYVGMTTMNVQDLIQVAAAAPPHQERSSSPVPFAQDEKEVIDPDMKEYTLKLDLSSLIKNTPEEESMLRVKAKFVSYANLRRRFWLGLAKAFTSHGSSSSLNISGTNGNNTNGNSGQYNKVLIQTMLDGLGSTLSSKTIDSFFTYYGKDPESDDLTFDEMLERLEARVKVDDSMAEKKGTRAQRRHRRRRRLWRRKKQETASASAAPVNGEKDSDKSDTLEDDEDYGIDEDVVEGGDQDNELFEHLAGVRISPPIDSPPKFDESLESSDADFDTQSTDDECTIQLSSCPICGHTGLATMLETDVITHIAVCSGTDGFNLDKLILGNFVTEANAQRKWITKLVKRFGYGRYKIGESNANILIQDRLTGAMLEEKMPTFIRLGIRLLYKSPAQKIRVGKILANMSRKQGEKFDDPRSKRNIEPFIRFHHLEAHMAEVLEPVQNFKSFNEFFYRKLKPNARTLASPDDNRVAVSVADCRMSCFQTISDATKFWIKGTTFTVPKLLDDAELAKKFDGGSLAIFRLAPQDYHRFHIPVRGRLSEPKKIDGQYYTVNPMAIRSPLDVYGENKRTVSTIESPEFGTVAYVSIGAMMVGSIVLTSKPNTIVERMDEHGYFAFGGSTIVVLFEPNRIQFDDDLLQSSKEQTEMLVRVGMRVGAAK
ncbi:hypothetical protein BGZ73_001945 [Actinomortierella ambigua]|nr:hypothetical protein BGZ73_001945 [Actinomortierella ambigua]